MAMLSIVTPTRDIRGKERIKVEAEDNSMVLMDHGDGVISHTAGTQQNKQMTQQKTKFLQ